MTQRKSYITLKDHKENFQSNPKFRLIKPSKTELGKVSKVVLDEINSIRNCTKVTNGKIRILLLNGSTHSKVNQTRSFGELSVAGGLKFR